MENEVKLIAKSVDKSTVTVQQENEFLRLLTKILVEISTEETAELQSA